MHIKLLCFAVCQIEIQFCVFGASREILLWWMVMCWVACHRFAHTLASSSATAPLCFICICALMGFYALVLLSIVVAAISHLAKSSPLLERGKKKLRIAEKWKQVLFPLLQTFKALQWKTPAKIHSTTAAVIDSKSLCIIGFTPILFRSPSIVEELRNRRDDYHKTSSLMVSFSILHWFDDCVFLKQWDVPRS